MPKRPGNHQVYRKRLRLKRETLRNLTERELAQAAGGTGPHAPNDNLKTLGCVDQDTVGAHYTRLC